MFGFKRKKQRYEFRPVDAAEKLLIVPQHKLQICVGNVGDYYAFLEEDEEGIVRIVWYHQYKVDYYG